ncbi:MAG: hypothetical protein JW839_21720 [Candidatus Lokiarchaeota archaeon]|nr:hypothetical protein [Candidatus Lokiarchaeota archaeon]
MPCTIAELDAHLDEDQKKILYIYALYSSEEELRFMQYTGMLSICFHLMKKGIFPNYKEQLLIYDYKADRRYLWEDKKFMNDINVLRKYNVLIRARARSKEYRDVNSHQISRFGSQYLKECNYASTDPGKKILSHLKCNCGNLRRVVFEDDDPVLKCARCGNVVNVRGFLYNLHEPLGRSHSAFFLGGDKL